MKPALDYIPEGQMSIFDYIEPKEKVKPKFKIGQRIYKTVLDVVETGKITEIWDVSEEYYGYRTDEDNITFWDHDLGKTVFVSKTEAHVRAGISRGCYKVIRAKDMKVISERNFIYLQDNSFITATIKILEGNMLYWNEWFTYHFIEKFSTEKKLTDRYNLILKKILNNVHEESIHERVEVNLPGDTQDMYQCANGKWSEYTYANRNDPVRR